MDKKNIFLFAAIISTLLCARLTHAEEEVAKKVGSIQAINGEILFNLAAPDTAGSQCFSSQLRIQANQVGKDQMLSLLITAKSTQRSVSATYTPNSGSCPTTSITLH